MSKTSAPQSGILLAGEGALRINRLLTDLKPLTPDQIEMVSRAKKYAMDQSIKNLHSKPPNVISSSQNSSQQSQLPKSSQRHQALVMMCRVYVGSISFELKEESVKAAFSPYGAIKSVNMSWDLTTMKHKGFAFVEYELPEGAQLAIANMNGIQLCGRQIRVGPPSNMPQADPVFAQIQEECRQRNRIYVSNVHEDVPAEELEKLFDPFGVIKSCKLALKPNDPSNKHRGYGFIEFDSKKAAAEALTMDKFELIEGQILHVCAGTTPPENVSVHGTLESELTQNNNHSNSANANGDEPLSSRGDYEARENYQTSTSDAAAADPLLAPSSSSNSEPRVKSMNGGGATSNGNHQPSSHGTSVLVLLNMVSVDEELDDSLLLDVYEECAKHGQVTQVLLYIDKKTKTNNNNNNNSESSSSPSCLASVSEMVADDVRIFIKYQDGASSARARQALNGRFFGGRKVLAEHYDKSLFRHRDYSG